MAKPCTSLSSVSQITVCAGSLDIAARAMEVDIAKAGLHMLIEKPISMRPAEEVERLAQVSLFPISDMHLHTDTVLLVI